MRSDRRQRVAARTRALAAVLMTLALAVAGLAPGDGPRTAMAATPDLTLVTATTYEALPAEGRVAVTATVTATNNLRDTVTRRYFFDQGFLAVLPAASNFAVSAASGKPTVAVSSRSANGVVLRIRFGSRLAAGKSIVLTLTYDLADPGGAPDRPLRISPSIVTFQAWASASDATPGSSVRIRIPEGYTTSIGRGPLTGPVVDPDGWQVYSSGPLTAPLTFVADITADDPGEYVDGGRSVTFDGQTAFIVIRAWPDDPAWRARVSDLVRGGLPLLAADIAAPWPYDIPLTIAETLVRGTGGFEGAFEPETAVAEIGYTANPGVILHATAHAWFNGNLVAERWIAEGFAALYAERAAAELGVAVAAPELEGMPADAAFPLNAWRPAGEATAEDDAYGAAASLALAREIADVVGDDVLREVWTAAAGGVPAYQPGPASPGSGGDEPAGSSGDLELGAAAPDWRGFLDLLEADADGGTAAALETLWRRWVIRPNDAGALDARAAARAAYDAAVAGAAPWTLPPQVRDALRAWQFEAVLQLADEAGVAIRQRAAVEAAAASAGLVPPEALRLAFEGAESLPAAAAEGAAELATIVRIQAAEASRIATPSLADRLGLIGTDPDADLGAARDAFEAGDLDAAIAAASRAGVAWEAAPDIGRGRIVSAALLGVALILFAWLVRQRNVARRPTRP